LLTERKRDDLAAAATWARANAAPPRDSHGSGADPARLQVYGRAAWQPGHAIVTTRNPSGAPRDSALGPDIALELPADEPRAWKATSACEKTPVPRRLDAGRAASVPLAPLQVLAWELASAR
jgi:hypothetical protein